MDWADPDWKKNLGSILAHLAFGFWVGLGVSRGMGWPPWWAVVGLIPFGYVWERWVQRWFWKDAKAYWSQALAYPTGAAVSVLLIWTGVVR
jgi:hypothetical protein